MLLATPSPFHTESLPGFVVRLAEANGYHHANYVTTILAEEWTSVPIASIDIHQVALALHLTDEQARWLDMSRDADTKGFRRFRKMLLPAGAVSIRGAPVCPMCLAERGFCDAFWDLAQAIACPTHGVMLVEHCPRCHKPLNWKRGKVMECRCGASLVSARTTAASPDLVQLMAAMRAMLYRDESIAPFPPSMLHLHRLGLARCCDLLWVMSRYLRNRGSSRSFPKARRTYQSEIERVARALSHWPAGFRSFLGDTYADVVAQSPPTQSFERAFGWLFTQLLRRRTPSSPQSATLAYSFITDEVLRFAAKYWPISRTSARAATRHLATPLRWGTRVRAARTLGVDIRTINNLVGKDLIGKHRSPKTRCGRPAVDFDDVNDLSKLENGKAIEFRRAAKLVGIPTATLREIRKHDLCSLPRRLTFRGSLGVHEVDTIRTRVREICAGKHAAAGDGVVTVEEALVHCNTTCHERALFFDALLTKPEWVVGRSARNQGARGIQIQLGTAERFFSAQRAHDRCMPAPAAAAQLGCSINVVLALSNAGHLTRIKCKGRWRPTVESVQRFSSAYLVMVRAAETLGVWPQWLRLRLDRFDAQCVRIRGQYNTIFVNRSDIQRLGLEIDKHRGSDASRATPCAV